MDPFRLLAFRTPIPPDPSHSRFFHKIADPAVSPEIHLRGPTLNHPGMKMDLAPQKVVLGGTLVENPQHHPLVIQGMTMQFQTAARGVVIGYYRQTQAAEYLCLLYPDNAMVLATFTGPGDSETLLGVLQGMQKFLAGADSDTYPVEVIASLAGMVGDQVDGHFRSQDQGDD